MRHGLPVTTYANEKAQSLTAPFAFMPKCRGYRPGHQGLAILAFTFVVIAARSDGDDEGAQKQQRQDADRRGGLFGHDFDFLDDDRATGHGRSGESGNHCCGNKRFHSDIPFELRYWNLV